MKESFFNKSINRFRELQSRSAFYRIIWFIPALLAFLVLGLSFTYIYFGNDISVDSLTCNLLLTIGWSVALTGIAVLLPRLARRIYLIVMPLFFAVLCVTHGIILNIFHHFFSFSDMAFAGDGAAFVDGTYIIIRKLAVFFAALCFLLGVIAAFLVPRKGPKRSIKKTFGSVIIFLVGVAVIIGTRLTLLKTPTTVVWDPFNNPASAYASFTDSNAAMKVAGLYQYTCRDFWLSTGLERIIRANKADIDELNEWIEGRAQIHEANDMSGIFKGKNLLLIQLESIDTWMLQPNYMPYLSAIKADSISFAKHFSPAYITGGTFNTEFIANTSLLLADQGTSVSVYTDNTFTNTLPMLFREKGYTARSFHGSEGNVYNRGPVHKNLGYERYYSGTDMNMPDYFMDTGLMNGFEEMTEGSPFYSFIVTISGHGPYTVYSTVSQAHFEEASRIALRSEDNYVHAVAHAMETDAFIHDLFERFKIEGFFENTVVAFYADHYNYYMMDDPLIMELKDADNYNMAEHTDFFIWSADTAPMSIEKPSFTADIMPTLANMFDLNCDYAACFGDDAFSARGGYVIFKSNAWYDGSYHLLGENPERDTEISQRKRMNSLMITSDWFSR